MKTKRKNRYLPLLVLTGVLAVLCAGYAMLSASNARKEAERRAELEAAAAPVVIPSCDPSTLTELTVQPNGAEPLHFRYTAGVWSFAEDAAFPLRQAPVQNMAAVVCGWQGVCTVDDADRDVCGLTDPLCTITAQDGTGQHTYRIGTRNSFNGAYYLEADGAVYMVPEQVPPVFLPASAELMQLDTIPHADWQNPAYVENITLTAPDGTCVLTEEAEKKAFFEALQAVQLTDWVTYKADAEEKAGFGLDGTASAAVKYKKSVVSTDENGNPKTNYLETTYTLLFGRTEGDSMYVAPAGSPLVYRIPAEQADALLTCAHRAAAPDTGKDAP